MSQTSPSLESAKVGKAAAVIGAFTLMSRILGLARDMVLAAVFGSGMAADAFFVAFRIPNLLRRLFAEGSLTVAFVPVFTEYLTRKGRVEALELGRLVFTVLSVALVAVTLLGVLSSPWIVRLQAYGFGSSGEKYALTVLLTRIMFPYIFLISLVAFFMGVLNSFRHFAAPAAAPVFLNVGMIAGAAVLAPLLTEPVVGLALGVVIGGFLQLGLQIPWALKVGFRFRPLWDLHHPGLRRIGALMLPAIFGSAVYQINQFVGTLLASFLPEGSISWLYYADRLVQFPLGVFGIAISTAALPSLSSHVSNQDHDAFRKTLFDSLGLTFFIVIPATVGLIVLGKPIINLLLERGAFQAKDTEMTYVALLYYALGLWAFSGIRVVVSGFYALQDTRTPVKVATAALVLNTGASLLLMGPLRHGGLALALSLASSFQLLLLIVILRRRVGGRGWKEVMGSALRALSAAIPMGIGVGVVEHFYLPLKGGAPLLNRGLCVLALLVLGVGLYLGASALVGCRELRFLRPLYRHFAKKTKELG